MYGAFDTTVTIVTQSRLSVPRLLRWLDDIRREHLLRVNRIEDVVPAAEFAVDFDVAALLEYGSDFVLAEHSQHRSYAFV